MDFVNCTRGILSPYLKNWKQRLEKVFDTCLEFTKEIRSFVFVSTKHTYMGKVTAWSYQPFHSNAQTSQRPYYSGSHECRHHFFETSNILLVNTFFLIASWQHLCWLPWSWSGKENYGKQYVNFPLTHYTSLAKQRWVLKQPQTG